MSLFSCQMCNYMTNRQYNYNKHLKTKKHLTQLKKYGVENACATFLPHNDLKIPHNALKIPHKTSKIKDHNDKKKFNCEYCDKSFSRVDNLNRHISKFCKKKIELDKLKKENDELIEKQNQIIKSQSKQLTKFEKLLNKSANQINNTQNNDHSNNKTINNIHINNYGEENLEMLTDEFKKQCVRHPCRALISIIEKIHFNDDYPENKNIRLVNKRDNKLQIKDNGKWNYKNKEEALRDAIDDSNDRLEQFCDEKSHHFRKIIRLSCKEIIKNVQESDTELLKNLYKDLDLILFNNK